MLRFCGTMYIIPFFYVQRIAAKKREEREKRGESSLITETSPLLNEQQHSPDDSELVVQINTSLREGREEVKKKRLTLLGLTWVSVIVCMCMLYFE